ncbi:XRE family transcriptional regulator [Macrococcoides caseolyticum subsp. caseolyticum]|uniref:helix-turn-helix transcriptional regulator n=1 Tax=Macrococcoides caseolyticum TaxID=69966 RepID=UPI000CD05ABF|nr:helix-turn-helix transcriptional regulator [Macrococcus caseolyticus]PNZ74851.1 XRE family transcriptional regulator [Macrococcus caseolyticus]QPT46092.1 helix-turn-helix transcriptional regulator [Macrococcus caseolyticus]RAK45534.1 XRE family transcriptional regulator [Macrococcus caseolyticus subsp. caseolyticus]HCD18964.1 XRE family transcriptional regulator [Macrococcus caseolyticus]
MSINIHFLLKKKREKLQLTQKQVADKVKISRSYYSDIENGRTIPSVNVLLRLNNIMNIFLISNDVDSDIKEEVR